MEFAGRRIRGYLIDLDGVLYVGDRAIDGASEFVQALKAHPHKYITNTTTHSQRSLANKLQRLGLDIAPDEILTAPMAARIYLDRRGSPPCMLVLNDDAKHDFIGVREADTRVEAVVVGDIGTNWDYQLLNKIFKLIMNGAKLIALHRNRFWQTEEGLQLDIGAFIAGLEYSSGRSATLIGKPSREFFAAALDQLRLPAEAVAMVGDDVESDVGGAVDNGMLGILVRTGKYRESFVNASPIRPELVLNSIADLTAQLSLYTHRSSLVPAEPRTVDVLTPNPSARG